jgi:2-polyprenyl-3-methyl-5-hydroxy-6-metoxy-1,4-benzoquinol methylase
VKFSIKKNKFSFLEAYPKPSKIFLKKFYSNIYFKKKVTASYSQSYSSEEIKNRINRSSFYIKIAKSLLIKKRKINFLEVGCGEGFLLKEAHKESFSVTGIDYQADQIKNFNSDMLNFFVKTDPEVFLTQNHIKYDVIAALFVLEHVSNPINFINTIKKRLNKNGLIIISVPNDFKDFQKLLLKKKLIKKNFWFSPPQHLNYFNNKNINIFFKKLNLKIKQVVADFPIEIFLTLGKNNYIANKKEGTKAHKSRILIDNFILDQGQDSSLNFYRACHDIGLGRGMIFFLKK